MLPIVEGALGAWWAFVIYPADGRSRRRMVRVAGMRVC